MKINRIVSLLAAGMVGLIMMITNVAAMKMPLQAELTTQNDIAGLSALDKTAKITFEESIPQPDAIKTQYCNNPTTNKGVEFLKVARLIKPSIQTSSPTHALTNQYPGHEFDEFNTVEIRFTTNQSNVGVKVGLDRTYPFPVTAVLHAYSSPTPGTGYINFATTYLGQGPTNSMKDLSLYAGSGNIRSVRIEFTGSGGKVASELLDDLTFDTIGPTCTTDNDYPTVQITKPAKDGLNTHNPADELAFTAQDQGTGIAKIQVQFLDSSGAQKGAFYVCGAPGAPRCIYDVEPVKASYDFYTYMPANTRRIRVKAWDFLDRSGQAERTISLLLPGPNMNLWVKGIEVTQGIQPWVAVSNTRRSQTTNFIAVDKKSIPFVAGKRTVVRVYPGLEGSGSIPIMGAQATLLCREAQYGNNCPGTNPIAPAKAITIDPSDNNVLNTLRADAKKSWNFTLPEAWTEMGKEIQLWVSISAPPLVSECAACDDGANDLVLSGIDFQDTAALELNLSWACVRRKASDSMKTCDKVSSTIHQDIFQTADSLFVQTMPVASKDINITLHNPQTIYIDGKFSLPNAPMTSDRMTAFHGKVCKLIEQDTGKKAGEIGINHIYFGIVPSPITLYNGLGNTNCAIAKIDPNSLEGDIETAAEEVGHALGRPHASCDHGEGGCEAAPAVFPCVHGGICTYGFDTVNMKAIVPGNPPAAGHAHDFMSYGDAPWWISPYTYKHLFDTLHDALPSRSARVPTGQQRFGQAILVSGTIVEEEGVREPANLDPIYQVPVETVNEQEGRGSYSLELQDGAGRVLFTRYFEPARSHGDPPDRDYVVPSRFAEWLPWHPDIVAVVLKQGRNVLAERRRSLNAPMLVLVRPTGEEHWGTEGWQFIIWEAADEDRGDELYYMVQYSADDGETWSTLAVDWRELFLEINSAQMAGSERARVRVFASDGLNTTMVESDPFVVDNKAPQVWINSPTEDTNMILQGSLLVLEGNATDLEDGALPDDAFVWFSHRDGELGGGRRVDLRRLSPGVHEITLRVGDSEGQFGQDGFTISVMARTNSQPIADAGTDRKIRPGKPILLDSSDSFDAEGDPLLYLWQITSRPPRSTPHLAGPDAPDPAFSANQEGKYIIQLIVQDGLVSSLPAYMQIEVSEQVAEAEILLPLLVR